MMISDLDNEVLERLYRLYGAGDGKAIHPIELKYFIEKNVVKYPVEKVDELIAQDEHGQDKYALYKYLRYAGYISKVMPGPYLLVYRKGFRPGEDRSTYVVRIIKKQDARSPCILDLFRDIKKVGEMRKQLVYAYLDEEKGPIFIKINHTKFD